VEDNLRWLSKARKYLGSICSRLSAKYSLPILIQTIGVYYGGKNRSPLWLGIALKTVLAHVAGNIYLNIDARKESLSMLIRAIEAACLLNMLRSTLEYYDVFNEGEFVIKGEGTHPLDNRGFWTDEMSQAFCRRGEMLRCRDSVFKAFWSRPMEAWRDLSKIFEGNRPSDQESFKDTLFAQIPPNEYMNFWAGLFARFNLACLVAGFREEISKDRLGLVIFKGLMAPPVALNDTTKSILINAVKSMFWERDWYLRKLDENPIGMILERPVLRIALDQNLYASSYGLLGDSLNWLVEASILKYPDSGGVKLPESLRQRFISESFEAKVNELFRRHGYASGNVAENGVWKTSIRDVIIRNRTSGGIPGQIDALAEHKSGKMIVIVECKVFSDASPLKNIYSKISSADSESLISRLKRKMEWIRNTDIFADIPKDNFFALVVLDLKMPWMRTDEFPWVLDYETLEKALSNGPL
jgi:hypothetical protein